MFTVSCKWQFEDAMLAASYCAQILWAIRDKTHHQHDDYDDNLQPISENYKQLQAHFPSS